MNICFTSFRLLTHLGVNNIWATGVFNKNRLRNCTIVKEKKQPQKKERNVAYFEQLTSSKKKQCKFDSGWFEGQQSSVRSFFKIFWT